MKTVTNQKHWLEANLYHIRLLGFHPKVYTWRSKVILCAQASQILSSLFCIITFDPRFEMTQAVNIIFQMALSLSSAFFKFKNGLALVRLLKIVRVNFIHSSISDAVEIENHKIAKYGNIVIKCYLAMTGMGPIVKMMVARKIDYIFPFWLPFGLQDWLAVKYLIVLWQIFISMCTGWISVPTAIMFYATISHICGQIRILCFNLENLNVNDSESIRKEFRQCIVHHKIILSSLEELRNYLSSLFLFGYMILQAISCFSLLQLLFLYSAEKSTNPVIMAQLLYIICAFLILSYCGQRLINGNEFLYKTIVKLRWYKFPTDVQKELVLFMLRIQFPFQVDNLLYTMSLGDTTLIFRTIYSYFMVLMNVIK